MPGPALELCSAGLHNLVRTCMQVAEGDRVLLVLEPEGLDFYTSDIAVAIESFLQKTGAMVSLLRPELVSDPADFPEYVSRAMGQTEHTLFLSRLGDYVRFSPLMGNSAVTLCYARTREMLSSPYTGTCFKMMSTLLKKLEAELLQAKNWKITCDLGTNLQGTFCWPSLTGGVDDDFSLTLFPITTFKPVPCGTASGTVALSRWLVPGAAVKTEPSMVNFDGVVSAKVEKGQLVALHGDTHTVKKVGGFLDFVSSSLGVNRNRIHSWHTGINPHTFFDQDVDENLEAWGATTFGSPRYLHFHTCGDVPPGEIAWSIFNPTVWIDDACYWKDGQFVWLQKEDNIPILKQTDTGPGLLQQSASIGV